MFDWFLIRHRIKLLLNDTTIMTFYLYQNINNAAIMTLLLASENYFFKKKLADSEIELHFHVTLDNLE